MINEFKDFIARGNVMDMAVGIIIGAAFTAIVTSLVGDLINPDHRALHGRYRFLGLVLFARRGGLFLARRPQDAGAPVFALGNFIMAIINFLIVAFVVFMLVKMVNRIKAATEKPEDAAEEEDTGPTELEVKRASGNPRFPEKGLMQRGGAFPATSSLDETDPPQLSRYSFTVWTATAMLQPHPSAPRPRKVQNPATMPRIGFFKITPIATVTAAAAMREASGTPSLAGGHKISGATIAGRIATAV
jgi:large conductance mechanosensitive channel